MCSSDLTNAMNRPGVAMRNAAIGAVVMPGSFLIGVQFGVTGLAVAWLVGFPLLTALTAAMSMPVIGVDVRDLGRALAPELFASLGMGVAVFALDDMLPGMAPVPRLTTLVVGGAGAYAALLCTFARPVLRELIGLLLKRAPASS